MAVDALVDRALDEASLAFAVAVWGDEFALFEPLHSPS